MQNDYANSDNVHTSSNTLPKGTSGYTAAQLQLSTTPVPQSHTDYYVDQHGRTHQLSIPPRQQQPIYDALSSQTIGAGPSRESIQQLQYHSQYTSSGGYPSYSSASEEVVSSPQQYDSNTYHSAPFAMSPPPTPSASTYPSGSLGPSPLSHDPPLQYPYAPHPSTGFTYDGQYSSDTHIYASQSDRATSSQFVDYGPAPPMPTQGIAPVPGSFSMTAQLVQSQVPADGRQSRAGYSNPRVPTPAPSPHSPSTPQPGNIRRQVQPSGLPGPAPPPYIPPFTPFPASLNPRYNYNLPRMDEAPRRPGGGSAAPSSLDTSQYPASASMPGPSREMALSGRTDEGPSAAHALLQLQSSVPSQSQSSSLAMAIPSPSSSLRSKPKPKGGKPRSSKTSRPDASASEVSSSRVEALSSNDYPNGLTCSTCHRRYPNPNAMEHHLLSSECRRQT